MLSIKSSNILSYFKMLRIHQWLKNALIFIPFLASHQLINLTAWISLIFSFFSFSLCASSVYIINDLLDLENDRQHPRKKERPFASGKISLWLGGLCIPVLLFMSFMLGSYVGGNFLFWLIFYFCLTCIYSLGGKGVVLVDCMILATLYTLRIIAGAVATDQKLSFWMLAFSIFLFLSLAFLKRYTEFEVQILNNKKELCGRGYYTSDAQLIQSFGIGSGYTAMLVLALYLNSEEVVRLYKTPEFIWGALFLMLFWISWMWMQAHRGKMHDDPLVFAIKDKVSLLVGIGFIIAVVLGAIEWQ
jgi:4-hydroxybenzoate polyprenyltransferase